MFLNGNHRQTDDENFYGILRHIRYGNVSREMIDVLNSTSSHIPEPPLHFTLICLFKREVQKLNMQKMASLQSVLHEFDAVDEYFYNCDGMTEKARSERLERSAASQVQLKVGCNLILTRKYGNLLPGSKGTLQAISWTGGLKDVRDVRLKVAIHDRNCESDRELAKSTSPSVVIKFAVFNVYSASRNVVATRYQLPVLPGYAITIHRSQGMTLDNVAISFRGVNHWRPNGMVYVALSRFRSLQGLWVHHLSQWHVQTSERAKEFMNSCIKMLKFLPHRINGVDVVQEYIDFLRGEKLERTSD